MVYACDDYDWAPTGTRPAGAFGGRPIQIGDKKVIRTRSSLPLSTHHAGGERLYDADKKALLFGYFPAL